MVLKPEYTTQQVADLVGVTKRCLLNWLQDGKILEPLRDRNDYRVWTQEDLSAVLAYRALRRAPEQKHAKDRDSKSERRDR